MSIQKFVNARLLIDQVALLARAVNIVEKINALSFADSEYKPEVVAAKKKANLGFYQTRVDELRALAGRYESSMRARIESMKAAQFPVAKDAAEAAAAELKFARVRKRIADYEGAMNYVEGLEPSAYRSLMIEELQRDGLLNDRVVYALDKRIYDVERDYLLVQTACRVVESRLHDIECVMNLEQVRASVAAAVDGDDFSKADGVQVDVGSFIAWDEPRFEKAMVNGKAFYERQGHVF